MLPLLLFDPSSHGVLLIGSMSTEVRIYHNPRFVQPTHANARCSHLPRWLRSVETGEPHKVSARGLLATSWRQLRRHLPAILAVAALSDGVMFLLHRLSHRLTNTGARHDASCLPLPVCIFQSGSVL